MIEKIEFSVEGQEHTNIYTREEYLLYLEKKRREYVGIHRAQTWILDGKKIIPNLKGGTPSYNWDCIIFEKDSKTLVVCNPDASIRFTILVPEELIKWEEYEKYFGKNKFFRRQEYDISFSIVDDFFEFENKFYNIVIVALEHTNEPFDAYVQERYLDTDTGLFLPFTKRITRRTPNQYAYNEESIDL